MKTQKKEYIFLLHLQLHTYIYNNTVSTNMTNKVGRETEVLGQEHIVNVFKYMTHKSKQEKGAYC